MDQSGTDRQPPANPLQRQEEETADLTRADQAGVATDPLREDEASRPAGWVRPEASARARVMPSRSARPPRGPRDSRNRSHAAGLPVVALPPFLVQMPT
jgi:hypothetical protein